MIIEKIAIFILFLGPLVFFHELGHYLFARLFGVRVEVFSIGFGPKIFKLKKGFTEYAVSLIPLGGYVKMFGDDPMNKDAIAEDERKYSFAFKGKWARFWIVMGGPLANFIMAYFIFFSLLLIGERIPEIRMGSIPENSQFYSFGIRSGDVAEKVNGKEIFNPSDIVLEGEGIIRTMTINRRGERIVVTPNMKSDSFFEEFMKYPPFLKKAYLVNNKAERFILSLAKDKPTIDFSLNEMIDLRGEHELYLFKGEKVVRTLKHNFQGVDSFQDFLKKQDLRPLDLMVKSVNMNSPADLAGMKSDDVVVALEGTPVFGFDQLRKDLQETKNPTVMLKIWRDGKVLDLKVTPTINNQKTGPVKLIGVFSAGEFEGLKFIETKSKGFFGSATFAISRTWETIVKTVESFRKLIAAEVSIKSIGGPLAIGKVASDSFNTSLSYFFQLMALISVNLGVINLFPIPVLDGGHIMFIMLEILNRGPVSRRKMEIAQQVGFSILLMLMVGAIFNDVTRFF